MFGMKINKSILTIELETRTEMGLEGGSFHNFQRWLS